MSESNDPKQDFLERLQQSLDSGNFIRLSLGKPAKGSRSKKCVISLVKIRERVHGQFVFTNTANVITKNHDIQAVSGQVSTLLGTDFLSASLFTTGHDLQYILNKKGKARLVKSKPTQKQKSSQGHDRKKSYFVDEKSGWLHPLGVATGEGVVKPSMYSKFRQIAKFIEIIDSTLKGAGLEEDRPVCVTDIGSGKGYLTFALYAYLAERFSVQPQVTGIDRKPDMIKLCNDVASRAGFGGLKFECGELGEHSAGQQQGSDIDILIALHACNTATDEAIYQGITSKAKLIVCAPCCQHEIAPQLEVQGSALAPLAQHGLFRQRQADLVTDIARTLLLESAGYSVKVIEFISSEHTSKNVMIVGTRSKKVQRKEAKEAMAQYLGLKQAFGFKTHKLETLLGQGH